MRNQTRPTEEPPMSPGVSDQTVIAMTDGPAPPVDRTPWMVLAIFWSAFLMLSYMETFEFDAKAIASWMAESLLGVGLCWAMFALLRRADPRRTQDRMIWAVGLSLLFCGIFALASMSLFYISMHNPYARCAFNHRCTLPYFLLSALNFYVIYLFLFVAWAATCLGIRSSRLAIEAERSFGDAREQARIAELRALTNQVNPHFLFNCLNSLGALIDRGSTATARTMIGEMSGLLRYGLSTDPLIECELDDEIAMEARYLEIERHRFANRLRVTIDVAPEVRRALVPSLILRPLVENAIKHGVATTSAPVRVTIRARPGPDCMVAITVEDDAPPAREGGPSSTGVGLRNVEKRLRTRYGDRMRFIAGPAASGGYRVVLKLPLLIS